MSITDIKQVAGLFKGRFCSDVVLMQERLFNAKAYVFDWDGVFNNGNKTEAGSSPFSEIDSMGINMLRFNHYQRKHQNPIAGIITGEKNNAAYMFAKREHLHAVYYNIKNKKDALMHLCGVHGILPSEVVYFFDDVLDLSVAEVCGMRIMIGNDSSPMFQQLVQERKLADYITSSGCSNNALREAAELLIGISGRFEDTIMQRVHYTEHYAAYIEARNVPVPVFYTTVDAQITEQSI